MEVVPQKAETGAAQVPEISCMPGELILLPTLLKVIVGSVTCATKLYHTSYTTGAVQGAIAMTPSLVAPYILPVVLEQVKPDVSETAPAQALFAGAGSITQILNVVWVPLL
jgi:hypothetical protein